MKITKFAQSCILIETKGCRILIDPGCFLWEESLLKEHWKEIDLLLVTHKHPDHCHEDSIKEFLKNKKTLFYASKEVSEAYPELKPKIVKEGEIIKHKNIKVEVVKAVHGYIPSLKGGKEIRENIGFIIDDGEKRAYQTSDTICFENNYLCDILFVPVSNHGVVMGAYEAALFAKETKAKLVIPIHYDNPKYPVNLPEVEEMFKEQGLNIRILKIKESIDF